MPAILARVGIVGLSLLLADCAGAGISAGPVASDATVAADSLAIIAREQLVWAAELRRDRVAVDTLMAPDYTYLSSLGIKDRSKQEDLDLRFGPEVVLGGYRLSSLRAVPVTADAWAVHYMARQRILRRGTWICPRTGTSETWVRRDGRWLQRTRTEYLDGGPPPPVCVDSLEP